jgi:hypothetical protein
VVQTLPSLQSADVTQGSQPAIGVPAQTPLEHTSLLVQALLSLQTPPLFTGMASQTPVEALQTPRLHVLVNAEQLTAVPAHTPAVHRSFWVQRSPSSQGPPSLIGLAWHMPVEALHKPSLHASSRLEQSTGVPEHTPPAQLSLIVQLLPSLHGPPLLAGMASQSPVDMLHVPTLHALLSEVQSTGVPAHVPEEQMSPVVQRLPSLHIPPSFVGTASHIPVAGLHVPTLQVLVRNEQSTGVPAQTPPPQTSPVVQLTPSLQEAVLLMFWQTPALHWSVVQTSPSSQSPSTTHAPAVTVIVPATSVVVSPSQPLAPADVDSNTTHTPSAVALDWTGKRLSGPV